MKRLVLLMAICLPCLLVVGQNENILKNPGFSDAAGFMKDWEFFAMAEEVFDLTYDKKEKAVDLESSGTEYSAYLNQVVSVKPDTEYILRVNIRHFKGRCLLWVVGLDDKKEPILQQWTKYLISFVGNPLVPDFIRREYMYGDEDSSWKIEELRFKTEASPRTGKKASYVRVNVGIYFSTGKIKVRKIELIELGGNKDAKTMEKVK